ncbi:minor tail protein [Bacillus phage pW2]|uniref:Minor tail protein n=1 Tax=Bacillus phage pW2 TaxID=2500559 RepID=A0A3T0IHL8_9CAUD|nr:tail protein [Bacillus phage pW2]AZU98919.1 minor tail protein [Bacillus phage pW2]
MALSGSFGTDFSGNQYGGGYRLQVEWSATQNIANNTSTIMTRLYLISKGSSWTINSSASKYVEININGNISSSNIGGLASLGGNQKKEIFWHQVTVNHESDGTKGLNLYGRLDINVTLSGVYYGKVDCSQWITLDTIPRSSTLTTAPDITAGRDHTFSINRYSSEFDHKVRLYVNEVLISELNGQTTGGTFQFTDAQVYTMYQQLNKTLTKSCRINLQTFRYGTYIGENNYYGTCYNWGGGVITFNTFNFGDRLNFNVSGHPKMKHTIKFYFDGTLIKTLNNVSTGSNYTDWSVSEVNAMLAEIPNGMGGSGEAIVTSYWINGGSSIQVWNDIASGYWANAGSKARAPVFAGNYTYKDTNATTVAITANNQHVIQGKSTVQVEILTGNKATAQDYSTMVEYVATLNGVEKRIAHSATATMTFDFGTVSAGANSTLTVKAVDSRGLSTSISKTVTVLPYSLPTITTDVARRNNFETLTTIPCSGSMSSLNGKNAVSSVQLRYKETIGGTFTAWENFVFASTVPTYACTTLTKNLDNTKAWTLEIKVTDKLGTTTITRTVSTGAPIFFIDYEKATLGVGKFPENASNGIEIVGKLEADGIISKQGTVQIGSLTRANHGNGATEITYNELTTDLNILGRNWGNNTTHDINMRVSGRIYAKEIFAWNNGGIWFDSWGNIRGTDMANTSGNTWSIKDGDGRNRFLTYIGKGATGSTEISAYTSGIDLFHDGYKMLMIYQSGSNTNRILKFGDSGGMFKWQNSAQNNTNSNVYGRFETRSHNDGGWSELAGNLYNASSREYKENIKEFTGSAIDIINSATGKTYHYKEDESETLKIGLIAEEAPEIVVGRNKDTIDSYGMVTLSWIGIQEHDVKINYLTEQVLELKKEIEILKGEN